MKLNSELYNRIEKQIHICNEKYEDVEFDIKKSNTTNSIYIQAYNKANEIPVKLSYRFSDHRNSSVKTKIISKNTKFSYINRVIDKMVKDVRNIRFKQLMNQIGDGRYWSTTNN